tara:strand:+ start:538 stop:1236 length:699 start_codon:yes stop_codon:yes gene_type:complete
MSNKKHQDYIYLKEDYYSNPKESFEFIKDILCKKYDTPSILDLGCARGELLYYLKKNVEYKKLVGIDYSDKLINEAKKFKGLEGVDFEVASADNFNLDTRFDIIIMSGVLSYFDDINKVFKCMKNHLKAKGEIIIFGFFNEYDVDLQVKYRNNKYFNNFENGWNMHSIITIAKELKKIGLVIKNHKKFTLSFKSEKQDDPCRAWNIQTEDGIKFTNGLNFIYDMSAIEIINI